MMHFARAARARATDAIIYKDVPLSCVTRGIGKNGLRGGEIGAGRMTNSAAVELKDSFVL